MTIENEFLPIDSNTGEVTGRVIVTLEGNDYSQTLDYLGLTMESSDNDIMGRLAPIIQEQFSTDITEYYKVRKAVNSSNIHIIPNSTAGVDTK